VSALLPAGAPAPGFAAPPALASAAEAGAFVLFLPLAGAPVCRADVLALKDAATTLGAPRRPLLVVSVDAAAHARRFLDELGAAALRHHPDPELALAAAYGVARRDGICERASFLVGRDGRVAASAVHPIGFARPLATLHGWLAAAGLS
jgi:peroxiredoxin